MGTLKLNDTQFDKFKSNVLVFLIPLAVLYLGQISATFSDAQNVIQLTDFYPTSVTIGGMAYYLMSMLIDYKKKYDTSNN